MNNIGTVRGIAERIARGDTDFGRVNVRESGPYRLLIYRTECLYTGNWTDVERACRGLVIRQDGKIMALPFERIFNLGHPEMGLLPDEPHDVYRKIDGSLVVFWHDGGDWRATTKGDFDNPYIDFALEIWQDGDWGAGFPEHYTVMCEVVLEDDEMQRPVAEEPGLYLLAVRDRRQGTDLHIDQFGGYPRPKKFDLDISDLDDREARGKEGWVVRFDNGFRVKVKTAWYLRMFSALKNLDKKHIHELMLEEGRDVVEMFPDELRHEAQRLQAEIEAEVLDRMSEIYDAYSRVADIESRKEFALTIQERYPDITGWLFRLRDGKSINRDVLREMEF